MKEAARILKPGGTFVMTDNNPKSAVIQNLPPALFTLMKSTEPHSNEYYQVDIEGMLRSADSSTCTRSRRTRGIAPCSAASRRSEDAARDGEARFPLPADLILVLILSTSKVRRTGMLQHVRDASNPRSRRAGCLT